LPRDQSGTRPSGTTNDVRPSAAWSSFTGTSHSPAVASTRSSATPSHRTHATFASLTTARTPDTSRGTPLRTTVSRPPPTGSSVLRAKIAIPCRLANSTASAFSTFAPASAISWSSS